MNKIEYFADKRNTIKIMENKLKEYVEQFSKEYQEYFGVLPGRPMDALEICNMLKRIKESENKK